MTCSLRPGTEHQPGQAVAGLAAAPARVAAPVPPSGWTSQLDPTDAPCGSARSLAPTAETETALVLSPAGDPVAPRRHTRARGKVARPLLSSDGAHVRASQRPSLTREEPDHLLDVNEAAVMLGIAPATLRNWAYQRRLPKVKLGGSRGPLRFRVSDLQRFIRASVQAPLGARVTPREIA